jgi:arginine decarboxylase
MLNRWQIKEVKEQSGIKEWGLGYFSIDKNGQVTCNPNGENYCSIPLAHVVMEAKRKNITTPMIIRFPQIIKSQLSRMYNSFQDAINEFNYKGKYRGAFPFKVNQRREFIDAIISCGKDLDWGLEIGSKTEFVAALSYEQSPNALLICNGFKDCEFIEMAFCAAKLGKKVVLVIEGPDELELMIKALKEKKPSPEHCPSLGLRIRLYSKGSGKWEKSSGEVSKFGLTTVELMHALGILEEAKLQNMLTMLHFHIGSQVTEIKRFKNALREAARVYSKIVKSGFSPQYLNIGGGVGVDYDGSQTSANSSANYSLQQFANDAVYVIGEVCKDEKVPEPDIVTESGRVIAAHHSIVISDIREVQGEEVVPNKVEVLPFVQYNSKNTHKDIKELHYIYTNITNKNYIEFYHDAVEHHEDLFTLFNLGYLTLKDRSIAEFLFNKISLRALHFASLNSEHPKTFDNLKRAKVSKYLANFSIFQSIPDAWSIGQLFPILPLTRHDEQPSHKATIMDITCDSDGCIDRFIDKDKEKPTIDLHTPDGNPYYIGFFLVGAYQESLANEHNLFGAINEVEVKINKDTTWKITKTTSGDPIKELLVSRNYSVKEILESYQTQINKCTKMKEMTDLEGKDLLKKLNSFLDLYPYLKEKKSLA